MLPSLWLVRAGALLLREAWESSQVGHALAEALHRAADVLDERTSRFVRVYGGLMDTVRRAGVSGALVDTVMQAAELLLRDAEARIGQDGPDDRD